MALVTPIHIRWREPITIRFRLADVEPDEAVAAVRRQLSAQFPTLDRPAQCVYVVRMKGRVAVAYGNDFSPVIYIGEGDAARRLYQHANWIADLLVAVPNAEIEVWVADCVRPNDTNLCMCVEADLIDRFIDNHGCLPWFNRQREIKFAKVREYSPEVRKVFNQRIGKVQGSRFLWAIRPTANHDQYDHYKSGQYA